MSGTAAAGRRAKASAEGVRTRVCVLSTRRQTLDELEAYLNLSGIATSCRRSIVDFRTVLRGDVSTAVLFPDEFTDDSVDTLLAELRRTLPRALVLVVTDSPKRYVGRAGPFLRVLPKPPFAWDILDAIRAHATRRHD